MSDWLIEESTSLTVEDARHEIEQEILDNARYRHFSGKHGLAVEDIPVALRLTDLIVHDNKKWWGEAEIRVDSIVIQGNRASATIYEAKTIRFERVRDGDRIIEEPVLLYYGHPGYFIDFSLCVSRNTKDSDDLSNLIGSEMQSSNIRTAMEKVLALSAATPESAVLAAAVAGASQIGTLAYKVLRGATGATVGVYRASWLQHRDNLGIGKHLPEGCYRRKDLSFQYEIVADRVD